VVNTARTVEHDVDNLWGTVIGLEARTTWHADPNMATPPLISEDCRRPPSPGSVGRSR